MNLLFYRNYICMLWTGFIEDRCEYVTLEKMLWIGYSGYCCGYVTVETMLWICYTGDYAVNMLQWRLCCGYVKMETAVDMLQ